MGGEDYIPTLKWLRDNFSMKRTGLIVFTKYPFMGASPDAVVHCNCHGTCPFNYKDNIVLVEQAVNESGFCLQRLDGVITLTTVRCSVRYF